MKALQHTTRLLFLLLASQSAPLSAAESVDAEMAPEIVVLKPEAIEPWSTGWTLNLDNDALREIQEEARKMGLSLTDRQVRAVDEASDAQTRMRKSLEGLTIQLGAEFAPGILHAADDVASFTQRITDSLPTMKAYARTFLGIEAAVERLTLKEIDAESRLLFHDLFESISFSVCRNSTHPRRNGGEWCATCYAQ